MKKAIPIVLLIVMFAMVKAADAQPPPMRVPYVGGVWYMDSDPYKPAEIRQHGPRALFINEHGSPAWGTVQGNTVFIPEWTDGMGNEGLVGRIRGDRIIWPNGSFWSR